MNKDLLVSTSNAYDSWIGYCAFIVFIGLVVEVVEILHEQRKDSGTSLFSFRFIGKIAGPILITVGVFGEWFLGEKHSAALKDIRQLDDREIAETRERAALAETRAAEAKAAQAKVELQLELVRKRQAPRELNRSIFIAALKDHAKSIAEILYLPEDTEAQHLALEMATAMSHSGWNLEKGPRPLSSKHILSEFQNAPKDQAEIVHSLPLLSLAGGSPGISLVLQAIPAHDGTSPSKSLIDALIKCGFGVSTRSDKRLPRDVVRVIIGPKP